jgi:SAM-dependent methyltransferase
MADGCSLPFRTAVFDAVFALHVLGHAEGPGRQRMASEIFRVLRNGGELFFRGFAVGDMRYGKGEEIEPGTFRRGNGIITHYFTEQETKELFSRFTPGPVGTGHWKMWIRGKELPRAEIAGRFRKNLR